LIYHNGPDMLPQHVPGVASNEMLSSNPELLAEVLKNFPEPPGFPKFAKKQSSIKKISPSQI